MDRTNWKKHNLQFEIFSVMDALIFVTPNVIIFSIEIFKWGVHVHEPMLNTIAYINEKDFIVYNLFCCNVWLDIQ